jgi:hypothetical protein
MMTYPRALLVAVAAACGLVAAGGCSKHQTEMILVIMTEGVRVPEDVHKVHLTVADRQGSLDDTVYDADVELCNPMLSAGCYDIPVTAVLFPGKAHGTDSVRVQVDAIGGGGTVIADAALFTFADQESLRLDFVLYANCLGNVECAARDQACGPLDTCIDLKPGQTNGPLDLALPRGTMDMSIPPLPDMTMVDLAGADLTTVPADLTQALLDMAGCTGVICDMGEQCIAGQCHPCGAPGDTCCAAPQQACSVSNTECNGSICIHCGGDGELCCTMTVPACQFPDNCVGNMCQMPPLDDMSMMQSDMSMMPSDMMMTGSLDLF